MKLITQVSRKCGRLLPVAKILSPERLGIQLQEIVSEFDIKTKAKVNKGVRIAAIKTFTSIVKMTPVGNPDLWVYKHPTKGYIDYLGWFGDADGYVGGRARNNWFLGTKLTEQTTKQTANKGTGYINKDLPKDILNSKVFFYNNLPYINRLEYGSHSTQAPKGMVRLSLLKWRKNLRSAFRAMK